MDLRPPITAAMDAFSVPAVVTLSYTSPVTTRGIWVTPITEDVPIGAGSGRRSVGEFQRLELKRIMALSKTDIPKIPIGTEIVAPEISGGPTKIWKVDALELADDEHNRVVLVEVDC